MCVDRDEGCKGNDFGPFYYPGEKDLTKVDWYDRGVSLACCKDCTSMYRQE